MFLSIDIIKNKINENILHVLWVAAGLFIGVGIWIGKNESAISNLEKTSTVQWKIIEDQKELLSKHEWTVINHENRLLYLERNK